MNAPITARAASDPGGARPLEVVSAPERAREAVHPERRRLLEALGREPDSAAGLARRLGESRQRLNYHLRALEEAGLVEVAERRRRGNFEERVLRPVALRLVLDPHLGAGIPEAGPASGAERGSGAGPEPGDRFSAAFLVGSAARTIHEVGELIRRAEAAGKRAATAAFETEVSVGSPAAMRAFVDDLSEAVAEVVTRHHDPGPAARTFRVTLGAHQAPEGDAATDEEEDSPDTDDGASR